jgi:hypothetical protein
MEHPILPLQAGQGILPAGLQTAFSEKADQY